MNVKKLLATAVIPFAVVGAMAAPASADHFSNNRATFTGDASGTAIVNYSEGQGKFNAGIRVRGLVAGTYTYTVNGPGGIQVICSFDVGASGTGGCSAQDLTLKGFTTAEIRQGTTIVDSDRFTRQGKSECREPDQMGTESQECPNRTV